MTIFPKLNFQVSIIKWKSRACIYVCGHWQADIKMSVEIQRWSRAKSRFTENGVGELTWPDFQAHYAAAVIETTRHQCKGIQSEPVHCPLEKQANGKPKRKEEAKHIWWRKDSLLNIDKDIHIEKNDFPPYLTPYTRFNRRWIVAVSGKGEIVKLW